MGKALCTHVCVWFLLTYLQPHFKNENFVSHVTLVSKNTDTKIWDISFLKLADRFALTMYKFESKLWYDGIIFLKYISSTLVS